MHLFFLLSVYLCDISRECARQPAMERLTWTITECRDAEKEVRKNDVPFPTMSFSTTCTPKYKWLK